MVIFFLFEVLQNCLTSVRRAAAFPGAMPTAVLILPSVQINIRTGEMPPSEDNGVSCLKIPINAL